MPVVGTASAAGAARRNGIYAGSAGHAGGRVYIFILGAAEAVAMVMMLGWKSGGMLTAAVNWTVVVDARAARVAATGGMPRVSSGDGAQWSVFRSMKFGCESDDNNDECDDDDDDGKAQIQFSVGMMGIGTSKTQEA